MALPDKPGFYYFRHAHASPRHIWVAQVTDTVSSGLFATVFASRDIDRIEHRSVGAIRGSWFGPIPSPETFGA